MERKSKLEIIDETVAYYGEDLSRRAINDRDECVYVDPVTGNRCAVGRYMVGEVYFVGSVEEFDDVTPLEDSLVDQYKGHSVDFWGDLQTLHDSSSFWNLGGKGLSASGKLHVSTLKKRWKQ